MLKYDKTDLLANDRVLVSGRGPYKFGDLISFLFGIKHNLFESLGLESSDRPYSSCRNRDSSSWDRAPVATEPGMWSYLNCIYGNIPWIWFFRFVN